MEFKSSNIRVIIGVGNPGDKYDKTYHNAGIWFVRFLLDNAQDSTPKEYEGSFSSILTLSKGSSLVFSEVFMNRSGEAASEALSHLDAKPSELLLVHDDTDIPLGSYKFAFGRSSAGHNGVLSVSRALQTNDFWRLRIGVRDDFPSSRKKAEDIVLRPASKAHRGILEDAFQTIFRLHDFTGLLS
tara:strand:+ start:44 stop:598 length:555 start_codon:yes stop_codon:yes gene_type:complete